MTKNAETVPTPLVASAPATSSTNMAVARCCEAYQSVGKTAKARGKENIFANLDANYAYRRTMPPLSGPENIRDFIACTAHGMPIGAITGSDAARLLYAAQVAYGALRSTPAS